jgi:flagellar biosynthesis anti-sigma factor FlgM
MKISNTTPNYINQTYTNQADNAANLKSQKTSDESIVEPKTDSIVLSDTTKDLQKISKAMEVESPDRAKYVEDIKQQVETDQYNVNAENVAEKMLGIGNNLDDFL